MESDREVEILDRELRWLLEEQVTRDLADIHSTLMDCSRRFPYRNGFHEQSLIQPQRNLLSNPNNTGQIKCVATLIGDSICDADISFKHKAGKDHHIFKTKIQADIQWNLQQGKEQSDFGVVMDLSPGQVQDASNHLATALALISANDAAHVYTAHQVAMLLEELMKFLTQGRTCLAFPKRKSIEELIHNSSMQTLQPPVPSDVVISFYVHSSKLILAVYHLHHTSQQIDITSRHQVECSVQWLNEAVILFTLAIQQCQQLHDKLRVLQGNKHS